MLLYFHSVVVQLLCLVDCILRTCIKVLVSFSHCFSQVEMAESEKEIDEGLYSRQL